ncbi:PASTA domain-containing protein [Granulicella cerasi]|uniref:PASTA domain-containing protein n=1 Tax=Granulicella cerasi TaxID=741063 RepID=A0ABW1Z6S5_9BACT|nr:PASTA domain-containing protein [Granulicella cerasi]
MKRLFIIAFTALTMIATMLVMAGITMRIALHTGETDVPSFSGMTVSEATDAALRAGLDLTIENKFYSTTVPTGRILSQAPAVGSQVRKGWQVRVTESLGPQQVTIPDVVGKTERSAAMAIRRDQLDLGTLAHLDAPGDADIVLAQTPPPDAGVDQPRISLLLSSSGSGASAAFVLPSFVGLSYPAANRAAAALGLKTALIGQTTTNIAATALPPGAHPGPNGTLLDAAGEPIARPAAPPDVAQSTGPSGPVVSQSPESGHRANRGDVVRLTFSHLTVNAPAAVTTTAPTEH